MASGEGSKRSRDSGSGDAETDKLTSGGERANRRAVRGGKKAGKSRVLPLSVALVALASAGAIVWYGKVGSLGGGEGQVPIITASETPERVPPEEPGGLQIPFQDNAVLNNGETAEDKVERILPPPEEPMTLARAPKQEEADEAGSADDTVDSMPAPSTDSSASAPLVALNEDKPTAADEAEPESDPIGELLEQVTEGETLPSQGVPAAPPPVPAPPQVASAGETEGEAKTDAGAAQDESSQVVPATAAREVGPGTTPSKTAESLLAKPAVSSQETTAEQQTANAAPKGKKKTREFPIVLPPQMPTVDLQGEEGGAKSGATQQAAAPKMESPSAAEQPKSDATQQAATTPAVVTKEVEQPAKTANGQEAEQLPTDQQAAKPLQVAQPRMQELPKNSYIIQVAALRSEEEAKGFWSKAQKKHPDLLETMPLYVERADLGDRGIYFRVQTGPFPSKATAQDLCGQLKSAGQDCIVKRSK